MAKSGGKITSSLFWSFSEKTGAQAVSLVISVILARLIAPEAYGVIAAVQIFTSVATTFATGGLSSALIRKKDADDIDYSSMFYYNSVFSIVIYLAIYFSAPLLVRILNNSYDYDLLVRVLRVLGVGVLFASFNSFYRSRLEREMAFKKTFFVTLIGTFISACVGIYMAYAGYGVWALVAQNIVSYFMNSVTLVCFSKWHPKLQFSWKRLKPMLVYGYKLGASSLLTTLYLELNGLVIGAKHDSASLAYYKKGLSFPKLIVGNIVAAINMVLFPAMAKMTKREEYVDTIRKMNKMSSFIIAPMMLGFSAIAPSFIELLLGKQWVKCVPFLQLACVDYALQPMGLSNLQYWKASGKATLYLVADITKKIIGIVLLILAVTLTDNVMAILVAQIISTVFGLLLNMIPQGKFLEYSVWRQLRDVLPQYSLSVVMSAIVYGIGHMMGGKVITLIIQIVAGIVLYLGLAKLFKMQELNMTVSMLKNKFNRT